MRSAVSFDINLNIFGLKKTNKQTDMPCLQPPYPTHPGIEIRRSAPPRSDDFQLDVACCDWYDQRHKEDDDNDASDNNQNADDDGSDDNNNKPQPTT